MANEPSDDEIEVFLKKRINNPESEPNTHKTTAGKPGSEDQYWMGIILGAILNLILFFIIPLSFSILGAVLAGCMAGGIRKGVIAGFLSGLISGIVIILLFFMGTGVTFTVFLKTLELYTGVGSLVVISMIALAFGALYSIIGVFGGGIGGILAHITQ